MAVFCDCDCLVCRLPPAMATDGKQWANAARAAQPQTTDFRSRHGHGRGNDEWLRTKANWSHLSKVSALFDAMWRMDLLEAPEG